MSPGTAVQTPRPTETYKNHKQFPLSSPQGAPHVFRRHWKTHWTPSPHNIIKGRHGNWGILPHCSESEPRDTASSLPVVSPVGLGSLCCSQGHRSLISQPLAGQGPLAGLRAPASLFHPSPCWLWTLAHSPSSGQGARLSHHRVRLPLRMPFCSV